MSTLVIQATYILDPYLGTEENHERINFTTILNLDLTKRFNTPLPLMGSAFRVFAEFVVAVKYSPLLFSRPYYFAFEIYFKKYLFLS